MKWWFRFAFGIAGAAAVWGATSEERAVAVLVKEVPAWFAENGCYSCHNNGDGARALLMARGRGLAVPEGALADTLAWLRRPEGWDSNRGDAGSSDKGLARMQFSVALAAAGGEAPLEPLLALQGADGGWHVAGEEGVSSPVTWGTALATALVSKVVAGRDAGAARRGVSYLKGLEVRSVVEAGAVLMVDAGNVGARRYLLGAVGSDGGWGPRAGVPGEVFDTAVALIALRGVDGVEAGILERGREWLVARQLEGGGWPETTRPSGGTSYAQYVSTTGWALMALVE